MAVILQCIVVEDPLHFIGCFLSFGFGAFLFGIAFHKDLMYHLNLINRNLQTEPLRGHILKQLIEFVDLHSNLKQLSDEKNGLELLFFIN